MTIHFKFNSDRVQHILCEGKTLSIERYPFPTKNQTLRSYLTYEIGIISSY